MAEGPGCLEAEDWATQQTGGDAAAGSQDAESATAGREKETNAAGQENHQASELEALPATRISWSEGQKHQGKGISPADQLKTQALAGIGQTQTGGVWEQIESYKQGYKGKLGIQQGPNLWTHSHQKWGKLIHEKWRKRVWLWLLAESLESSSQHQLAAYLIEGKEQKPSQVKETN